MQQIELKDWLMLWAVLGGPVVSVVISFCMGLWWQRHSEKRADKMRIFNILMTHRRVHPWPVEWEGAANLIGVAFKDHPDVTQKWENLYKALKTSSHSETEEPQHASERQNREEALLTAMGEVLGYKVELEDIQDIYRSGVGAHAVHVIKMPDWMEEFFRNSKRIVIQELTRAKKETPRATTEETVSTSRAARNLPQSRASASIKADIKKDPS